MRTFPPITLSTFLVLACTAAPAVPAPDAPGDSALGEPGFSVPGLPGSQLSPSGARVRLVNAYAPLNGDPGPVDVFSGYVAQQGQQPLATVGYGQVSGWFDPGADSSGNAHMSWYPSGRTSEDDKLGDQSATLAGGEQITIFLATGDRTSPSGARYGQWLSVYEKGGDPSFALATPGAGKALLLTHSVGLPNTYASDDSLQLSAGDGCLFAQGVVPGGGVGPQPVGGGGSAVFELEPGPITLSVHAYPSTGTTGDIDCTVPAVLDGITVTLAAGARAYLLLHAPGPADLRGLVVPID